MLLVFKFYTRFENDLHTYITILQDSVFVYKFTFTRELYTLVWLCVAVYHPFAST